MMALNKDYPEVRFPRSRQGGNDTRHSRHNTQGVKPISKIDLKKYADKNNAFSGSSISNIISR